MYRILFLILLCGCSNQKPASSEPPQVVVPEHLSVLRVGPTKLDNRMQLPRLELTPSKDWVIVMTTSKDELEIRATVERIMTKEAINSIEFAFNNGKRDRIYTDKDERWALFLVSTKALKTKEEMNHIFYSEFPLMFPVYDTPIGAEVRLKGTVTVQLHPNSNQERFFNDVKGEGDKLNLTMIEHTKDYVRFLVTEKVKHGYRNPLQLAEFLNGDADLLLKKEQQ